MTEQVPCRFPDCERAARLGDPEAGALEVCREHRTAMDAAATVEAWGFALNILKPWVESARAVGHAELTDVMEHALAEAEWEADLARAEAERAEAAL